MRCEEPALKTDVGWAERSEAHHSDGPRSAWPILRVAALLLAFAPVTHAERYRVDLIVFIDRSAAAGESMQPLQLPEVARAVEPYEGAPLRAGGFEILPDASFGLTEEWNRLRNSKNHQPVLRVAWLQKDPPAERGASLRLHWGNAFTQVSDLASRLVYPIDGTVALLAGRFLHLDAEMIYTQADPLGELRSFRLKERRRLRRDELHHLDSPRIGILARAQLAKEAQPAAKAPAPAAAKPKPKPKTP